MEAAGENFGTRYKAEKKRDESRNWVRVKFHSEQRIRLKSHRSSKAQNVSDPIHDNDDQEI